MSLSFSRQQYLVSDVAATELKVNWLFWFLCVDLADSHNSTLLQEEGQGVTVPLVAHSQGSRYA